MKKITYYIEEEQYQALRKEAYDRNITISALLREILQAWMEGPSGNSEGGINARTPNRNPNI